MKLTRRVILGVAGLGWVGLLFAQAKVQTPSFKFSGSADTYGQYDGITGHDQGRPKWVFNFSVTPSLSYSGFSFKFPIFLSSLESPWRQAFNRFGFNLDKKWMNVNVLDAYPKFSEYTLNGILLRGGSIDLSPGPFRLAVAGGQTRRAVYGSDTSNPSFQRVLFGAKLGWGKETGAFFAHLNFLDAWDRYDPDYDYRIEVPVDRGDTLTFDSLETITPQENMVASLSLGTNLFKNKLYVKGEIGASSFARDSRSPVIVHDYIPPYLHPRLSSEYDLAVSVSSRFTVAKATIDGAYKRVGSAFHSLGNPYLLNDIEKISLGYKQSFFKNQLSVSVSGNRYRDNLLGLKTATTTTSYVAPTVSVYFQKMPYLTVSYTPYWQKNDARDEMVRLDSRTMVASASSGYSFSFLGATHAPSLSVSFQNYESRTPFISDTNNYDARTVMLSSYHSLKIPVSFNWGVSLSRSRYTTGIGSDLWTYNGGVALSLLKNRLTPGFYVTASTERGDEDDNRKLNFYVRSSYRLTTFADLSLTLQRTDYEDRQDPDESYDETLARLGLSIKW